VSPASCELIDHRAFFTDSTKRPLMLRVFTALEARAKWHPLFGRHLTVFVADALDLYVLLRYMLANRFA